MFVHVPVHGHLPLQDVGADEHGPARQVALQAAGAGGAGVAGGVGEAVSAEGGGGAVLEPAAGGGAAEGAGDGGGGEVALELADLLGGGERVGMFFKVFLIVPPPQKKKIFILAILSMLASLSTPKMSLASRTYLVWTLETRQLQTLPAVPSFLSGVSALENRKKTIPWQIPPSSEQHWNHSLLKARNLSAGNFLDSFAFSLYR